MIDVNDLVKEVEYIQTHSVEIGILGDGGSVKGLSGGSESETTVLIYGSALEYGTSKMKPFAYFRKAISDNSDEIGDYVERVTSDVLEGNLTGKQALMQVGEYVRGLIVQTIASAGSWARSNSEGYQKWKSKHYPNRANQPLILDGFLIKSIRYKIIKGGSIEFTSDWAEI
ncbi:MAG: hypothetical protein RSB50_06285 [Cetobacterium sp.]